MKRITQRSIVLAVTLTLAFASVAMGAPKGERSKKYLTIEGRVLHVNPAARTMLVSADWSDKLYWVNVPKGSYFKITFGLHMNTPVPDIRNVRRDNRVRMECIRGDKEHLARLDDGREVVVLTAAH